MKNGVVEVADSVPREMGLSLNLLLTCWVTLGSDSELIGSHFHSLYELINTFSHHNVCHKILKNSKVLMIGSTRVLRSGQF